MARPSPHCTTNRNDSVVATTMTMPLGRLPVTRHTFCPSGRPAAAAVRQPACGLQGWPAAGAAGDGLPVARGGAGGVRGGAGRCVRVKRGFVFPIRDTQGAPSDTRKFGKTAGVQAKEDADRICKEVLDRFIAERQTATSQFESAILFIGETAGF